jgi:hypothetical protein
MPPSEDDKDSVLEQLDQKLVAVMEAQRKLRDRLASVQLDPDEAFEIKTLLLQLDMKADEIMRDREAFEEGRLTIEPPSDAALEEMSARIKEIREINVKNQKASDVIAALTKVAGKLPKPK